MTNKVEIGYVDRNEYYTELMIVKGSGNASYIPVIGLNQHNRERDEELFKVISAELNKGEE